MIPRPRKLGTRTTFDVRPPRESDLDALFRIHADPRTHQHWPQAAMRDVGQAEAMLKQLINGWREQGISYWAVTGADRGDVIGFGGVRVRSTPETDYFNLYYRLTPEVWGRGIATRVAARAVALAHEHPRDLPVVARVRTGNLPSERAALSAGLSRIGHDPDGLIVLADRRLSPSVLASLPERRSQRR